MRAKRAPVVFTGWQPQDGLQRLAPNCKREGAAPALAPIGRGNGVDVFEEGFVEDDTGERPSRGLGGCMTTTLPRRQRFPQG
jgi:hypothetical protein